MFKIGPRAVAKISTGMKVFRGTLSEQLSGQTNLDLQELRTQ